MAKRKQPFNKWTHLDALRAEGFVVICWTPEDMPGNTQQEKEDALAAIARDLEDRSVECGWDVISTL